MTFGRALNAPVAEVWVKAEHTIPYELSTLHGEGP